jgi:ATP/maltotriose-dependent transcriptional regulator MalT
VLVAQIARILHDKCIFYRFQATERDTAPFLAWIAEQFEVYFPNHSDQFKTIRNLLRQGLGNQEVIANLIGKIMQQEQITQTIYVIIDDYHYITQDSRVQIEFDKILMVLIGQTPHFLKFIIASRTELPNYAEDTIVFKNVGLKKGEAKKLVAKLDLSISNKTMEFLYTALNGYFLAWRAILDLKKKLSLTENDIMSLLSESNEAFHE